ncbi:MAG: hypothetical protein EA352_04525 [Gemmatimonadales bacterium]|nr:MAG: hypothetical protein EA352_04525 [Gemmatimonadales bacterium]
MVLPLTAFSGAFPFPVPGAFPYPFPGAFPYPFPGAFPFQFPFPFPFPFPDADQWVPHSRTPTDGFGNPPRV